MKHNVIKRRRHFPRNYQKNKRQHNEKAKREDNNCHAMTEQNITNEMAKPENRIFP